MKKYHEFGAILGIAVVLAGGYKVYKVWPNISIQYAESDAAAKACEERTTPWYSSRNPDGCVNANSKGARTGCSWDAAASKCSGTFLLGGSGGGGGGGGGGGSLPAPSLTFSCQNNQLSGNISWSEAGDYSVDFNDADSWAKYWNKFIDRTNRTTVPDGFGAHNGKTPATLALQPNTAYYTRIYNMATKKTSSVASAKTPANCGNAQDDGKVSVDLKVNFSDNKVTIFGFKTDSRNEDINYHYSWTSQNATSCTSNFNPSTAISASGKAWAAPGTKNFTVTCTNGTSQASDSVKVVSLSTLLHWQANTKLFMDGIFGGAVAKGWVVAPDFPAVSLRVIGSVTNTNVGGHTLGGEKIYNNIARLPSLDVNENPANDVSEGKHRFEITIPSEFRDGIKRFLVVSFSDGGTIINENRMVIIGGSSGARNLNNVNLEFTCQSDGSCTYKCVWPIAPLYYGSPRSGPMCQNLEW